jgi:calcineurin-like phosphoesterase family protein
MKLTKTRRACLALAGASLLSSVVGASAAAPAGAYSSYLTRAPYLTDRTTSAVKVNFATTAPIVEVRVKYGLSSGGTCSTTKATAATTSRQGYTITYPTGSGTATSNVYQWKAQLSALTSGTYCYRLEGATSTTSSAYVDLLGSTVKSPTFSMAAPDRFAVIGDWGQTGGTAPSYLNSAQANVISHLAGGGSDFAVSTGDIGYPSGTQSTYGDLQHTGRDVSAVFGPRYWPVAGKKLPMYPVPGNHGFTSTFASLWPSTSIAAASHGRASTGNHTVNGVSVTTPDYWYAFNVHGWRIYILTAAWSDSSVGNPYATDYKVHWAPGAAERTWLTNDLAANSAIPKIAVMHYPMYSAVGSGDDVQDSYLTAPTDGSQSVEDLLASHNVKLLLNGHSHIYERNRAHHGMVTIISGGGGADPSPVDTTVGGRCSQTYPDTGGAVVAVARGWSSTGGSACNGTAKPTSAAQVYHYVRVTLGSGTAKVEAIDSNGTVFDSTTVS